MSVCTHMRFQKICILKASIMVPLNLTLKKHTHEYEASDTTTNVSKSKALDDTQEHKHIRKFCSRHEQKLTRQCEVP